MGIEVRRYAWDYIDSNMYVIKNGNNSLVIDPIDDEKALRSITGDITVLLTHEHFDHICGLNKIRTEHNCFVIAQAECSERIQDSRKNLSALADIMIEIAGKEIKRPVKPFVCKAAEKTFCKEYSFSWNTQKIRMISTPGHSPGSVCIIVGNYLFSGDTLLANGPMNRFPGGCQKTYQEFSIPLLKKVLINIEFIYPGHGDVCMPNQFFWI